MCSTSPTKPSRSATKRDGLPWVGPPSCPSPSLPFSPLPYLWPALRLHVCRSGLSLSLSLSLSPSVCLSVCLCYSLTHTRTQPTFLPALT
mmetsp:Transcript_45594/g.128735  ORF Transcript_45594/g.128735 Transcript_45594/m.128735 type:complete len:90 (+) Transcript_45594:2116-2385(+)